MLPVVWDQKYPNSAGAREVLGRGQEGGWVELAGVGSHVGMLAWGGAGIWLLDSIQGPVRRQLSPIQAAQLPWFCTC